MPRQGPGTKLVMKGLERAFPDISEQEEQALSERQGPGTKFVLKGLKYALPTAESHGRDSREHTKRASHHDGGKNLCKWFETSGFDLFPWRLQITFEQL